MEENGVWRTVSGRRIFIKDGQSLSEAMEGSGKFEKKPKKTLEERTELRKKFEHQLGEKKEELAELEEKMKTREGYDKYKEERRKLKEELKKIQTDYINAKYSEDQAKMAKNQEEYQKKEMERRTKTSDEETAKYRAEREKFEKSVIDKFSNDENLNKELDRITKNIEDEILDKKGLPFQEISSAIEEKIFSLKDYTSEEKEILYDEATEKIYSNLRKNGFTNYGDGYNSSDIIYKTHSDIEAYLDENNIDYNVSRSAEAGFFASIYLENGERIGDHDNGRGGNVFKTRDLIENWKSIVDKLIKK